MSESDSDNNFESADEDTEEIDSQTPVPTKKKISQKIPEVEITQLKDEALNCKSELIDTQITVSINDKEKDYSQTSDSSKNKKSDSELISISKNVENVSIESKSNKIELSSNTNEEVSVKSENFSQSVPPDVTKESKESFSAECSTNSVSDQKDKIDVPPKRVTLRLKKKLQKKNMEATSVVDSNVVKENEEEKEQSQATDKPVQSSWGFSSWGTSLLSTAASSVSTFTNQVSQGIGTVFETVETTLGAPPPEDLATLIRERQQAAENDLQIESKNETKESVAKDDDSTEDNSIPSTSSIFTGVSSLTKVLESTGSIVLSGGLNTLELIGKKTMDLITEGDPGFRKKRSVFSSGTTLSQMLREAKEKAEKEQLNTSSDSQGDEAAYFSTLFDDFQGLIHLEALEMLSSQCQNKVQGSLIVLPSGDSEIKDDIDQIRKIFEDLPCVDEVEEDYAHDFERLSIEHLKHLQLQIDMQKIIQVHQKIHQWLDDCINDQDGGQAKNPKDLYKHAISSLAEFSAKCVEQFHKFGELILVQTSSDFDIMRCITHLTGLTTVLCLEVVIISHKYCQCLNTAADDSEDPDAVMPLITTVYLESSDSISYIQDAFQLLIPVLQETMLNVNSNSLL